MEAHSNYQTIIENYIYAYNHFEVDKMMTDMNDSVQFETISNGVVNMKLKTGDKIELKGKSISQFKNNKIIELTDIS